MLRDVLRFNFDDFRCVFSLLKMRFLVEFEETLIFQGFDGFLGLIFEIFGKLESGEMLDFTGFARSRCRSIFGDLFENWIFESWVWLEQM